ncbi:MAG: DUF1674 domain-containing protein [Gammaproteobacteria bacterium]|nr:DUF1674 domain-containing protein [Gammaproteobacteria bacterium]
MRVDQPCATENSAKTDVAAGREVAAQPLPGNPRSPVSGPRETGGPTGPEPTRFGDWERGGRCIDF